MLLGRETWGMDPRTALPPTVPRPSPLHWPVPPSKERPRVGACWGAFKPHHAQPDDNSGATESKGVSRVLTRCQCKSR